MSWPPTAPRQRIEKPRARGRVEPPVLFEDLLRSVVGCLPPLTASERGISLAVLRELASGRPAGAEAIARRAGAPVDAVTESLRTWPDVVRDDSGAVVGFCGLTLLSTPHRIRLRGTTLFGWCAWDTLFLAELLREDLSVESVCPATLRPVRLTVGPDVGVRGLDPAAAVITFADPARCDAACSDGVPDFCGHSHFFADHRAWSRWTHPRAPQTFVLTLDEAWRLGRAANRHRYGEVLDR